MRIQLILVLGLLAACGKDVKFTNQLETNKSVTTAAPIAVSQQAMVVKNTVTPPGKAIISGQTYNVSPFSSYQAKEFISAQAEGAQVPVRIRGEIKGKEVYISVIEQ